MSKRILSVILSMALLLGAVSVTGILSVSAANELKADGKVIATYEPVTKAADLPTDTQLNLGKLAFRYDRAAGYNLRSGGNKNLIKSMNANDQNDLPNRNSDNSGITWPNQSHKDVNLKMSDGVYLTDYTETAEAETNGTANIPIPWKSGIYWETDADGNAIADRSKTTFAGWPNSDDSQYLVYDLGASSQVTKIGISSGVQRPAFNAANAPKNEAELEALMGQTSDATQALTKVSVYVGNDLANLFGTPNKGNDGITTLSGDTYRVLTYDFSGDKAKALANIFTLTTGAAGRYVGFLFHYNGKPYINELAVYGEQTTTSLNTSNADVLTSLGDNWLSTAQLLNNVTLDKNAGGLECLTDGVIYGVTTEDAAYKPKKCSIYVDTGNKKHPLTGKDIENVPEFSGWGSFSFRLETATTLTHVLMAGSGGDNEDNRYVRFYEFYASDAKDTLFQTENRILCYDNTNAPQLALLHKLATPVTCTYVGVRFTGAQYEQGRISELAVYGTVSRVLDDGSGTQYSPIQKESDIPQRESLIAGKKPLNANNNGGEGTETAITDGSFVGVNVTSSYMTTTDNTGDPVPGETGQYFAYKGGYSTTNINQFRSIYTTSAPQSGLYLDELYPLTFDLGATCTVDALAIGSSLELSAWKKGQDYPKTEEAYASRKASCDLQSLLLKGEVYIGDSQDTLYDSANRVMAYDWSDETQRAKAKNNYFVLGEAKTGRYVGFKFNTYMKLIRVGELAVYGTKPQELDDYGTQYSPIQKESDIPQRESLIAGKKPLNSSSNSDGVAAAITDGSFVGVNVFSSYLTTTDNTGDPVPGEAGQYFAYNKYNYSTTNINQFRSVYTTSAPKAGLYLDELYPLTFDLGATCTVDALAIGSSLELSAWKKGQNYPKTAEDYATWKASCDLQSLLLKGEVYIGDSQDTLYDSANRVMAYDWSDKSQWAKAKNNYFILGEAKTGRYVGFKFNAREKLIRVGELAVYGTKLEDPSGVIQLTESNVNELKKLGENRLFGAEVLTGTLASGSGAWSCLSDGVIYGITTRDTAYKEAKCGIGVGSDKTNPITGEEIPGISGWGSASFRLMGNATLTHVLMAGSGGDEGNNRYVRFYEFYASMNRENLFETKNRIICYDNTEDPRLAQIHKLEEAVTCRYVGVRFTGEAYAQGRISEIGLYGDMEVPESLPFTQINSQAEYEAALANQGANLLKGERVGNKKKNYLLGNDMAISDGDEAWLTDDYINWTADDTEQKLSINAGSNDKFYYDLRGRVSLKSVLVASSGKDRPIHRPDRISVYMSDDKDSLFEESSLVGQAVTGGSQVAVLIDLSAKNASGRYIGFSIPGDSQYHLTRLTEMGVYGTYLTEPTPIPINLLAEEGAKRVDHFQVDARGIDNKTAVGANGAAGKNNNTGAMPSKRAVSSFENLDNLTDGDPSTRSTSTVTVNPEAINQQILNYDNSWLGFTYYLGGASKLDVVSLVSSNEWGYYITGVQIYASYYYKDLFTNDTLLYTSGGEHYTGNEDEGYLPDLNYEVYQREIEYTLTAEQQAKEYRYIAFVVTRAFPLYWPGSTNFCKGYGIARIGELVAYGEITTPEPPLNNTWEVDTRFGKATVTIEPDNYDDREFYQQIHHATIDEESIPAGVQRNVSNNWLTVVGDTLFHLRFWDANGKQINDTSNKRDVMVVFQIDHKYNYTAGIIRDGQIQRLYNAFVRPDNTLRMGEVNYPVYPETTKNNRDKATFQDMDASLVLLQWNDPRAVDALNGNVHYGSVAEFFGTAVAGAATQTGNRALSPWWLLVPVALTAAGLTGAYLLRRRKRGAAEQ